MTVFDYQNYKDFYLSYLQNLSKKGHGNFRKLAHHLNVSPVIVSQIFKGDRHLSLEQAYEATSFFGFNKMESRYFLLLVQKERAGTHKLKKELLEQIKELQEKAQNLQNRIPKITQLSEASKVTYYSQWYYGALRLFCDIAQGSTAEELAARFQLPITTVRRIVDFLLENSLCIEVKGRIQRTPLSTHLEASHPLVFRHHHNWRIKALQHMEQMNENNFFFTGPMVLSEEAIQQIRQTLVSTIEKVTKITVESRSETLACLNVDWFQF